MLEHFFSKSEVNAKLHGRKLLSTDEEINQRILLSGPPHCGKSSLLLQFAYNCARQTSANVVFICRRNSLEKNPPFLPQDVKPSSEIFERVHMKYVEDDDGIRKYFAAFHMHKDFPRAIIIDDFCEFFDEGYFLCLMFGNCNNHNKWLEDKVELVKFRTFSNVMPRCLFRKCREKYGQVRGCDVAMVRTLALCCDAINHANEKLQSTEFCKLLISDTHVGDTPRLLYIYQRWIPYTLTVKAHDGFTFTLKVSNTPDKTKIGGCAKYTIVLHFLTLVELQNQ